MLCVCVCVIFIAFASFSGSGSVVWLKDLWLGGLQDWPLIVQQMLCQAKR